MNVTEMSYAQLEEQRKQIEDAMRNLDKTRKTDAKKAVRATAKEYGFTIEELFDLPVSPKSSGAGAKPKYRNPENQDETWSGRGRKPQWIKEAVEKGADLSSFEI